VQNGRGLEVLDTLRAGGLALHTFELERPTLEEVFLKVVTRGRDAS
jgi:hypothetical protein